MILFLLQLENSSAFIAMSIPFTAFIHHVMIDLIQTEKNSTLAFLVWYVIHEHNQMLILYLFQTHFTLLGVITAFEAYNMLALVLIASIHTTRSLSIPLYERLVTYWTVCCHFLL